MMTETHGLAGAHSADQETPAGSRPAARRAWQAPRIERLPRLTDLTLVTGDGIGGGESLFP